MRFSCVKSHSSSKNNISRRYADVATEAVMLGSSVHFRGLRPDERNEWGRIRNYSITR